MLSSVRYTVTLLGLVLPIAETISSAVRGLLPASKISRIVLLGAVRFNFAEFNNPSIFSLICDFILIRNLKSEINLMSVVVPAFAQRTILAFGFNKQHREYNVAEAAGQPYSYKQNKYNHRNHRRR